MTNCYRREFVVKDRAEAVQAWLCGDEEAMAQLMGGTAQRLFGF